MPYRPANAEVAGGWVLIHGDRGSGKRSLARTIHSSTNAGRAPFLTFGCRSSNALELRRKFLGEIHEVAPERYLKYLGLLEEVQDGTLYVDEVEHLSLDLQAVLAEALETRSFRPLGSPAELSFRGRLIASSSVDLAELVEEGRFHPGLFDQISTNLIRVGDS